MSLPTGMTQEVYDAAQIKSGSDALLAALWQHHKPRLLALRERGLNVVEPAGYAAVKLRGGPQPAWPDCPLHLRNEYARLARRIGGWNARRIMEAAA